MSNLKGVLQEFLGNGAGRFNSSDLDKLPLCGIETQADLEVVSRATLAESGLRSLKIDYIESAQKGFRDKQRCASRKRAPSASSYRQEPIKKLRTSRTQLRDGQAKPVLQEQAGSRRIYDALQAVELSNSNSFVDIPIELRNLLALPTKVLEREQYQKLSDIADSTARGDTGFRMRKLHISGSPKVGKSCWLALELVRQVQAGRMVILQLPQQSSVYFFSSALCTKAALDDLSDVLNLRDTRYLVDSDCPRDNVNAMTVLSSTPDRLRGTVWNGDADRRVLADLSLQEAQQIREQCYPDLAEEEVADKYARCGGSGLWLFKTPADRLDEVLGVTIQKMGLVNKIALCTLMATLRGASPNLASDTLLCYVPDEESILSHREFRSVHIAEMVYEHLCSESKPELLSFIIAADYDQRLAAIRCHFFQLSLRDMLKVGCKVTVVTVGVAGITELQLEGLTHQIVPSLAHVQESQFQGRMLWEPKAGVHKSFDLLLEPNVAAQATVSRAHTPLKLIHVTNNWRAMQGYAIAEQLECWLIVPHENISAYRDIPLQDGVWPEEFSGKRIVRKIVGIVLK